MDLHIGIELREKILLLTARGNFTFQAALHLLKQVCDTAKQKEANKILVNGFGMFGELSTLQSYAIPWTSLTWPLTSRICPSSVNTLNFFSFTAESA
jgi:hypothetical protein